MTTTASGSASVVRLVRVLGRLGPAATGLAFLLGVAGLLVWSLDDARLIRATLAASVLLLLALALFLGVATRHAILLARLEDEALRASEERFRTAFEDAPIGMALVGLDGRFLNVNGAMCGIVGYTPKELLARTFQDITWPEDLEADVSNVQRLLRGEISSYQSEKRYTHKQGHPVSALLTGSVVRDSRGTPLYLIGQVQDITERKQFEKALHFLAEAGPRLASSLDPRTTLANVARLAVPALADGCVVGLLDERGRLHSKEGVAASPEQSRLLDEMLASYPKDAFRPGSLMAGPLRSGQSSLRTEFTAAALEAMAEDEQHLGLLRRLAPLSSIVVPLHARGRILGAVILWTTESSGRRYGPHDLSLAEALASRAALAIDNARLHEKSEQATRTRDEVLRVVAHDLRTPLNVIGLSAGTLLRRLPESRATDTKPLESIRKAVRQANRLIQDLLDVARMEAGRLTVERRPLDAASLVREATELHRALAEAKSIQLTADVPEDAPAVFADQNRVLQILSNLLGNALKFTPEGGRISVRAVAEGGLMRFSVRDTGVGIPSAVLPHLFEPFWQAQAGTSEGAGLGLPIAKGLVEAHGGSFWVESSPGLGSTFSFTLPTLPPAEQQLTYHA
ncbi:GAF domain-containing sensor histidine kinase [Myxococcus sp. RHSTA-1-4]|uniref:sensor histidine kinase n=1 Tax=Myxococcus sp. RHSTA-1-4 TaxID=2874601 RepID=UPI001CC03BF4|nr:GAF domain-containing sensor histidine kinase [Myxococcus sp. RHSTA-1-4]MBZ4420946.1 PAS domain S-box protein [Myxococcus sp. RHSTA-1-4]